MTSTVLITGANRGIGLALCREYSSLGYQVIAICRNSSAELDSLSVEVIDSIDVSLEKGALQLKDKVANRAIDILINNAGILRSSSLSNLNFEDILEQFKVNAVAPLRVVEALSSNVTSGGKIAMITSRMGSIADNSSGSSYGYRMSKCALNAAGKSLAIDLIPRGIAVALLHPGYVSTEMVNWGGEISPDLSAQRLIKRIDELDLQNSGTFWHANGEVLPW
ncbi:SDR family oxidoreductase [Aliikangiella sp. IMCC44359]|uniref:SDR family oxidoreductase n=1 Tax=Aliikangiella sp. IMCC44359 TaxID=3459125 RepID=UPI00403A9D1C